MSPKSQWKGVCFAGLLACAALACATPPIEIEEARDAYGSASSDQAVADDAAVELYEASKTIEKADSAWEQEGDEEESRHLAYIAARQVEIARTAAERKQAEAEVARLAQDRDRVILEARTSEAENLRERAEAMAREAEQATADARAAQERIEKLEEELGATRSERGLVLTLGDVLFDTGKAELRPGALRSLYNLVTFLKENLDRKVIIEGHTDSTGTADFNLALSRQRAQAVKEFLSANGVSADRLVAAGYGQDYPVATNATSGGRQQNRRVEVVILDAGASPADKMRGPAVGSGR